MTLGDKYNINRLIVTPGDWFIQECSNLLFMVNLIHNFWGVPTGKMEKKKKKTRKTSSWSRVLNYELIKWHVGLQVMISSGWICSFFSFDFVSPSIFYFTWIVTMKPNLLEHATSNCHYKSMKGTLSINQCELLQQDSLSGNYKIYDTRSSLKNENK